MYSLMTSTNDPNIPESPLLMTFKYYIANSVFSNVDMETLTDYLKTKDVQFISRIKTLSFVNQTTVNVIIGTNAGDFFIVACVLAGEIYLNVTKLDPSTPRSTPPEPPTTVYKAPIAPT